jgi:hypothetical protein
MKNLIIFFLLGIMANSCRSVDYLYFYDNSVVESEIDSIPGCKGFAKLVRENFFYSEKDSLFFFNIGFTEQIRGLDYRDCFFNLSNEQISQIFGPSNTHFENGVPAYFHDIHIKYNNERLYMAYNHFFREADYPLENMLDKSTHYRKVKGYSSPNSPKIKSAAVNEKCDLSKEGFETQIFRNNSKGTIFINSSLMFFAQKVTLDDNLKCTDTFLLNEISSLFGKPHLISNDTLFYQTIKTPFIDRKKRNPDWKGKVFCVIFYKTEYKDYYKYGTKMVDPKRLDKKFH